VLCVQAVFSVACTTTNTAITDSAIATACAAAAAAAPTTTTICMCWCSISVSEDEAVGTTLLRLSATDGDHTYDNTRLEYSISSITSSSSITGDTSGSSSCWRLTEATGELILVFALDRETTDRYELTVIASDHGQPALTSTTMVSNGTGSKR